ncbi:hypothetical protein QJU23_03590 [Pasteurella atlantica]|uniref:Uncharacterized protein n=2 Tax=Pasteurellaceae TaxID=712 RepID=A0ACC6HKV0_9PAST|nr:hypothetical protein [Pasteurella atlantica]MDP8051509.1 hypothetical protein [Pasteurella atlantica]MDP8104912.1 hypothetical protein [Pasteurella atlantica]MDP8148286.1 hypothetical protein [Pasteurella atlantica]
MKNTIKSISQDIEKIKTLLFMFITLFFMPTSAFANIPDLTLGSIGVPGVDDNSSVMKTIIMIIAFIVFILVIAVVGFGLADTMSTFFRQLNDARKEGDWSSLLRFIGLAFAILAIIFLLMGYINKHVIDVANGIS